MSVASTFSTYVNSSKENIGGMDDTTAKARLDAFVAAMPPLQQFDNVCTLPNDNKELLQACAKLGEDIRFELYEKLTDKSAVDLNVMPMIFKTAPFSTSSLLYFNTTGPDNIEVNDVCVGQGNAIVVRCNVVGEKTNPFWASLMTPTIQDLARLPILQPWGALPIPLTRRNVMFINNSNSLYLFGNTTLTQNFITRDKEVYAPLSTFNIVPTPDMTGSVTVSGMTLDDVRLTVVNTVLDTTQKNHIQLQQYTFAANAFTLTKSMPWEPDFVIPTNIVNPIVRVGTLTAVLLKNTTSGALSVFNVVGTSLPDVYFLTITKFKDHRSSAIEVVSNTHVAVASCEDKVVNIDVIDITNNSTTRVMTMPISDTSRITYLKSQNSNIANNILSLNLLTLMKDGDNYALYAGKTSWNVTSAPVTAVVDWKLVSSEIDKLLDGGYMALNKNDKLVVLPDDIFNTSFAKLANVSIYAPSASNNMLPCGDINGHPELDAMQFWWHGAFLVPFPTPNTIVTKDSPHARYRYRTNGYDAIYGDVRFNVQFINSVQFFVANGVSLSNSGRIRSVAIGSSPPAYDSNFRDGFSPDGDFVSTMQLVPFINETMSSPNGLYVMQWKENVVSVFRNVYNSTNFTDWAVKGDATRFANAVKSNIQVCQDHLSNVPGDATTMSDSNCYCLPDKNLFDTIYYSQNIAQADMEPLLNKMPCITKECTKASLATKQTRTIASEVKRRAACDKMPQLCDTIFKSVQQVATDQVSIVPCGDGKRTGCTLFPAACAIGETCNTKNDICRKTCLTNNVCGDYGRCENGGCVPLKTSKTLSDGAIIGIVLGIVAVIAIIAVLALIFTHNKK